MLYLYSYQTANLYAEELLKTNLHVMDPVKKLAIIFRIQVGYFVIYSSICTLAISKMKLLFLSNPLTTISPFTDAWYLLGPRNSTWTHTCGAISICGLYDSDHGNLPNASPLSAWFNRLLMRDFGYLSEKRPTL